MIDPLQRSSSRWRAVVAASAVALVAAILFSASRLGVLSAIARKPGSVTVATQAPSASVTPDAATPGPPVVADTQKSMPADVLAWLKHLERTEKRRNEIATEQVAATMVSFAMIQGLGGAEALLSEDGLDAEIKPPTATLERDNARADNEWGALEVAFAELPPPTECVPIRNAYAKTLGETRAMLNEISIQIAKSSEDPKQAVAALMKMKGSSGGRVDAAAREADHGVGVVCARYDTFKWFGVSPDFGGGVFDKLGGF